MNLKEPGNWTEQLLKDKDSYDLRREVNRLRKRNARLHAENNGLRGVVKHLQVAQYAMQDKQIVDGLQSILKVIIEEGNEAAR